MNTTVAERQQPRAPLQAEQGGLKDPIEAPGAQRVDQRVAEGSERARRDASGPRRRPWVSTASPATNSTKPAIR